MLCCKLTLSAQFHMLFFIIFTNIIIAAQNKIYSTFSLYKLLGQYFHKVKNNFALIRKSSDKWVLRLNKCHIFCVENLNCSQKSMLVRRESQHRAKSRDLWCWGCSSAAVLRAFKFPMRAESGSGCRPAGVIYKSNDAMTQPRDADAK